VLLSPGGFRIEQFVTNCGGERLPCNCLYVSSVTFISVTVSDVVETVTSEAETWLKFRYETETWS